MFYILLKTEFLEHFFKNFKYFYIYRNKNFQKKFLYSPKTEISKTFLYLTKTEIFKNSFTYLSEKSIAYGCQPKNIGHSLLLMRFYFSITQPAFLLNLRRDFYIVSNYILVFSFSLPQKNLNTFHKLFLKHFSVFRQYLADESSEKEFYKIKKFSSIFLLFIQTFF